MLDDMTLDIEDVKYLKCKHGDNEGTLTTSVVLNNGIRVSKLVKWKLPDKTEQEALLEVKEFRRKGI